MISGSLYAFVTFCIDSQGKRKKFRVIPGGIQGSPRYAGSHLEVWNKCISSLVEARLIDVGCEVKLWVHRELEKYRIKAHCHDGPIDHGCNLQDHAW